MQAVKDKLSDMNAVRKLTTGAKAAEQEEKELAKARVGIAKEIRKAKEAEAAMDVHVSKAGEMAEREIAKHPELANNQHHESNPSGGSGGSGGIGSTMGIGTGAGSTGGVGSGNTGVVGGAGTGAIGGGYENYDMYHTGGTNNDHHRDHFTNTTGSPMQGYVEPTIDPAEVPATNNQYI